MIKNNAPSTAPFNNIAERLRTILDSKVLTNNGPQVQELEQELSVRFQVKHAVAVTNATIGITLAIVASCKDQGKIITTPFSFIATRRAIELSGNQPEFVDVDDLGNMDPVHLEKAISRDVVGILPVHVYGVPCDVSKINNLANRYNLPTIYDAAHCFDISLQGQSVFKYGTVSVVSLHSTKVMNSVEGAMVFTDDDIIAEKLRSYRNFGYSNDKKFFNEFGTNAKMSEIHAAFGLENLNYVDNSIRYRRKLQHKYFEELNKRDLKSVLSPIISSEQVDILNGAYMPVMFKHEDLLNAALRACENRQIELRRYFYPLICSDQQKANFPNASDFASKIATLPLHTDLNFSKVEKIVETISEVAK